MRLTLERRGQFASRAVLGGTQCGRRGIRLFQYRVKITVAGDWPAVPADPRSKLPLSADGFVADHDDVHAWMVETFGQEGREPAASCESIALAAAHGLRAVVPRASRIAVTVSGSTHAGVTATWEQ